MTENQGPECKACSQSEARCAFLGGCCPAGCTHFQHLDTDGNDRHGNRPECGTTGGYDSHRYRREAACEACKAAHSLDVQRRRRSPGELVAADSSTPENRCMPTVRIVA